MKIPKDKQLHFFVGGIIFNLSIPVAMLLEFDPITFGSILVFIAAFGKEFVDYVHNDILIRRNEQPKHSVEFMDFIATLLGAVPTIIFWY